MSELEAGAARRALIVISLGVLLATATWFSGTAAARELASLWSLDARASARLTSATQWGFITGTLIYALANLADRFDARRVFCVSALAGAAANLGFAWASVDLASALLFRFLTGVALAGVYPVGMKLVASWYQAGLGWRLGVMVGCLTLGTAFPYGVTAIGLALDWRALATIGSLAATLGGLLVVLACEEGPHLRARAKLDLRMIGRVFRHQPFRASAFGYFGHMWELYALWSLAGFWLDARFEGAPAWTERVPMIAFATVAIGALGCIGGGLISREVGERKVAAVALIGSGIACACSGFAFLLPGPALLGYLLIWGLLVVADSPQYSALAARHAPAEYTGTALTVQNGIGFLITIGSLELVPMLAGWIGWRWAFVVLAIGPLIGAISTLRVPTR
ncbi:MAG TPA: MFS transporter [Enhygromyxa sp.]|nr:MFS transporter [Enhygromyxa sp.]